MKITCSQGGVPEGSYTATLVGVEAFNDHAELYGPAVRLRFVIVGGEFDKQEVSRICSVKASPKSTLMKFAASFKGSPVADKEQVDFAKYEGLQGNIFVELTESGSSRVGKFWRSPAPQAAPQPAPQSATGAVASTDPEYVPF